MVQAAFTLAETAETRLAVVVRIVRTRISCIAVQLHVFGNGGLTGDERPESLLSVDVLRFASLFGHRRVRSNDSPLVASNPRWNSCRNHNQGRCLWSGALLGCRELRRELRLLRYRGGVSRSRSSRVPNLRASSPSPEVCTESLRPVRRNHWHGSEPVCSLVVDMCNHEGLSLDLWRRLAQGVSALIGNIVVVYGDFHSLPKSDPSTRSKVG